MRFISLLSVMALYLVSGSASIMSEQQPMREDALIRTSGTWEYTDCGQLTDPVRIESIELLPDPPIPGHDLTVKVKGTVSETLSEGAYADVTVKLGLVKLVQKQFDLCEEARNSNVSVQCPVEPGSYIVQHTVALPKEIPPAIFIVNVRGYTVEDEDFLCLDLRVNFMKRWLF